MWIRAHRTPQNQSSIASVGYDQPDDLSSYFGEVHTDGRCPIDDCVGHQFAENEFGRLHDVVIAVPQL